MSSLAALAGSMALAQSPEHWRNIGKQALKEAQARVDHGRRARNLILFVGDGMGFGTVAAARILDGQQRGGQGEENLLAFERFPYTALVKTYSTNKQVPDSASTMTAIITGVKTDSGIVAMTAQAQPAKCPPEKNTALPSLLEKLEARGLSTGLVSTARVTHATPASTYAHVPNRNWESDAEMPAGARGCVDIARQLVEFSRGDGPEVIMGGGRDRFLPVTMKDPEHPFRNGRRLDSRNLIQEWLEGHRQSAYIWNRRQFDALDANRTRYLLGLFEPSHMNFEVDRSKDVGGEPSLAEMTSMAITILKRNKAGFFLLVEGGRIDHGHHAGNAARALVDTIAFSQAVEQAMKLTGPDTLIVVTADHSHTLTISGYPDRGNPILGKVVERDRQGRPVYARDAQGLPYTTLTYANGPGHISGSNSQPPGSKKHPHNPLRYTQRPSKRPDLTDVDTTKTDYLQESAVPMSSETHGGMDVPVYASGPGAEWFHGVLEQNALYFLMSGAMQP